MLSRIGTHYTRCIKQGDNYPHCLCFTVQFCLLINLKNINGASQWIIANLMPPSHPFRTLHLTPLIWPRPFNLQLTDICCYRPGWYALFSRPTVTPSKPQVTLILEMTQYTFSQLSMGYLNSSAIAYNLWWQYLNPIHLSPDTQIWNYNADILLQRKSVQALITR